MKITDEFKLLDTVPFKYKEPVCVHVPMFLRKKANKHWKGFSDFVERTIIMRLGWKRNKKPDYTEIITGMKLKRYRSQDKRPTTVYLPSWMVERLRKIPNKSLFIEWVVRDYHEF